MKEIIKIPYSVRDFAEHYPEEARELAETNNVKEWNEVRERLKNKYGGHLVNFIDTNAIIKKKTLIKHYLSSNS